MSPPRDIIEAIRRDKFSIGPSIKQPLAPDLHRAIKNLSIEIYQNDMHFIKEIIQDNSYSNHVRPSLEFLLTNEDVTEMGVSATLLVLNNESGLTPSDVEALCSLENSRKKGRRDKGLIGCKGIGFKSVFMVCKTPVIISNGFRISFQDEASEEAGVGYIVPEWTETPTNKAILDVCGRDKLPTTLIILPLRHDKVDLVRRQLRELHPENILFLSKIRELQVVEKTEDASDHRGFLRITRSEPVSVSKNEISPETSNLQVKVPFQFFKVTLTVECDRADFSDTFPYVFFQGLFPVTHPVVDRQEIENWSISLAFPQGGRPSSGNVGDIFSFLPTELRTGFPFIINADFILTSSRESIKFDSMWNIGILDCIPAAFHAAFEKMILPTRSNFNYLSDCREAYRFLPVNPVENAYRYSSSGSGENRQLRQKLHVQPQQASGIHQVEKVRVEIFQILRKAQLIFLSSPGIDNGLQLSRKFDLPATSCLQLRPSFYYILKSAAQSNHSAPSAVLKLPDPGSTSSGGRFGIVDQYVQQNYASGLAALGVSDMTVAQYKSFISDSEWLVNLPDKIYLEVLEFVAVEMKLLDQSLGERSPLLKIRGQNGMTELASFSDLAKFGELLYTSSIEDAEWIYSWVREFSQWDCARVMPAETSRALIEARNSGDLMMWIGKHVSLTELSVESFAERLIQKFLGPNVKPNSRSYSNCPVLVFQFLYSGIHDKKLSRGFVVRRIQSLRHVIVLDEKPAWPDERSASFKFREEGGILLPREVSKWPFLFNMYYCCSSAVARSKNLITLSNRYLNPQCSLVEGIVTKSCGPDSMFDFIKEAFHAVDLPSIKLPAEQSFGFCSPVMHQSVLMLEWLKVFLPNRRTTKSEDKNDVILKSVKELEWVKTHHHGWRRPKYVFCPVGEYGIFFTARDLPLLDVPAYSRVDLTDSVTQLVFEELSVVTDMRKGRAAVVKYFSRRPARNLNLEAVSRFYGYLDEVATKDQTRSVNIWIPAGGTRKKHMWEDPAKCILSDKLGIFAHSSNVTVLDKIYSACLLPFFSEVLLVPEMAPVIEYCKIWMEWSRVANALDEVKEEVGCPQNSSFVSRIKVEHALKKILHDWQDPSEDSIIEDCSSEDSSEDFSKREEKEVWKSFHSRGWVPVAPTTNQLVSPANETISIVPPNQALIADDVELFQSFSAVGNGKLNFIWLLPDLSSKQSTKLVKIYSSMGVKKLSECVTSDVNIRPGIWKKRVPRGKGLICEGLFRSVLAYLCKNGENHGLSLTDRQQILSPLVLATEVVVGEPFEKNLSLHVQTLTSPATVTKNVFVHYDKVKRKLYYLRKDHALLEGDVSKRIFNSEFVTTVSIGILSEYPEIAQSLTVLLKLLCESGFAMKSVEYEFQTHNLSIFPEDEKLLMESIAKIPV